MALEKHGRIPQEETPFSEETILPSGSGAEKTPQGGQLGHEGKFNEGLKSVEALWG